MNENVPAPFGSRVPARPGDFGPPEIDSPFGLREMDEGRGFSLKRFLLALRRYWWIVALSVVAGVGAAFVVPNFVSPEYQAEGALWITTEGRGQDLTGPIRQAGLLESAAWIELLTSYSVLDPVVVGERLYLGYPPADSLTFVGFTVAEPFVPGDYRLEVAPDGRAYTLSTSEKEVLERGEVGGPIGAGLGFRWAPSPDVLQRGRIVAFSVVTPRDAARSLAANLTHRMDRQGNFIRLQLRGENPARTARTLNALMERHVEVAAELKRGKLDELTTILQEQLQTVESNLRRAEGELERYRVQTITLPSEESSPIVPGLEQTRGPVFGEFTQLRLTQEGIQRDRRRLEDAVARARAGDVRVEDFEMIPSVRESSQLVSALGHLSETRAELRALRERYTDEYGPVAEVIRREETLTAVTIPSLAETLLEGLLSREADMEQLIDSRASELSQIPPRVIEEARRRREYQIANDLYVNLTQRYETARLAAASSIPDVRILDFAVVPRLAVMDRRMQFMVLALAGALGLGFLLILLLDRFDPKLRDPAEIGQEIGLDLLGTIPRYRKGPVGRDNSEEIREAFRDLRMKIEFASGAARPLLFSVTSPSEAEGKTFVAANLANAFADLGRRTVLVDGDTRRGDLHHILARSRKPGLTDFLSNGGSHKVIQNTDNPKLHFVGFGSRKGSSPELLNSSNMQSFLAGLKRRYEVVIFDSPPMAAGSDAFILGAHAGNVLLVLRSGSTNKDLTAVKMESFLRLPVRILGAVLNDFTPQVGQGYYRYYSHYLPGYETSEEGEEEARVAED
jgi:polysaccharide biosynthesis transport protein